LFTEQIEVVIQIDLALKAYYRVLDLFLVVIVKQHEARFASRRTLAAYPYGRWIITFLCAYLNAGVY